jgi:hypothetical protein
MPVKVDEHPDLGEGGLEDRVSQVAGPEVEPLPEPASAIGTMRATPSSLASFPMTSLVGPGIGSAAKNQPGSRTAPE